MGTQAITSLEELHELISQREAWGWSLADFQEKVGVRYDGDTAYVTEFYWQDSSKTLAQVWELVQYIHKFYKPI